MHRCIVIVQQQVLLFPPSVFHLSKPSKKSLSWTPSSIACFSWDDCRVVLREVCTGAVSYTHLDVYKRQEFSLYNIMKK